jgi:hypothetical protein
MATGTTTKNIVLIPVDGSKNSIRAFECKSFLKA